MKKIWMLLVAVFLVFVLAMPSMAITQEVSNLPVIVDVCMLAIAVNAQEITDNPGAILKYPTSASDSELNKTYTTLMINTGPAPTYHVGKIAHAQTLRI